MSVGTISFEPARLAAWHLQWSPSGATVSPRIESRARTDVFIDEGLPVTWADYGMQREPNERLTYLRRGVLDVLRSTVEVQQSPAASSGMLTSRDFAITLEAIERLQNEEDDDDRPSTYARELAITVLREAATDLGLAFPHAIPAVGPNKSLRLHWNAPGREVRMVFGGTPENQTYLYWESSAQHGVDYNVDGRRLADSLRWVLQGI